MNRLASEGHVVEELNAVRCSIVEKNVSPERLEFLKKLLEHNGYTVMTAPTPPLPVKKPIASPQPPPSEGAVKVSPIGTTESGERSSLEGAAPSAPEPHLPPVAEKPAVKERKGPKKTADETMAEKLQHKRIADLKAAIGINEKFQFINELFEGNMKEYNCAVDQVNSFSSHAEAESYIANLKDVYKWQPDNHIAESFMELVERRFA